MITQTANISCMRGDPLHVIIRVIGVDLTGAQLSFAVGLNVDPVGRQWVLTSTSDIGSEGIRFVRIDQTPEGLPISIFEIIAIKERMKALPSAGEFGADMPLFFDLQTNAIDLKDGFAILETTLLRGSFTVKGSIND